MGWGTTFITDIYLNRQCFSNVYQVEEKIRENESAIQNLKQKLMMYVSSSPSEIIPEGWDSAIDFLHSEVKSILEELEDFELENYKLGLYLETEPFKEKNE